MSRFQMANLFQNQSDSSGSGSDSDNEKEQNEQQKQEAKEIDEKKKLKQAFDSGEESEEEQRVVRTQKDKKQEIFDKILRDLKNHLKIRDFSAILSDFESFTEEIKISQSVLFDDGSETLPVYILRNFAHIDNAINNVTADDKKKMSKNNSQSHNKLKQKFKKYLQGTGPDENLYEAQLAKFKDQPVWSEDELKAKAKKSKEKGKEKKEEKKEEEKKKASAKPKEEEEDDEEYYDDEDEEEKPKKKEEKKGKEEEKEEEDEEEEGDEYYDDEEGSEGEKELTEPKLSATQQKMFSQFLIPREQMTPSQRRLKWMKRECLPPEIRDLLDQFEKVKNEQKPAAPVKPNPQPAQQKPTEEDHQTAMKDDTEDFTKDYTVLENVQQKLKDVQVRKNRGKFDVGYHLNLFQHMLDKTIDTGKVRAEIIINLIYAKFDLSKSSKERYMDRESWMALQELFRSLMALLQSAPIKELLRSYQNASNVSRSEIQSTSDQGENENLLQHDFEKSILPAIANFIEKFDKELLKAYQSINHHKLEYLQRVKDENELLFMCDEVQRYLQEFEDREKSARMALIKLDHIHYKHDSLFAKMRARLAQQQKPSAFLYLPEESQRFVEEQVEMIGKFGTFKMRLRAYLYQAYHHALHNRFHQAKELLLKTHLTEIIHIQEIPVQILYNRASTQLGMAAFRLGNIRDCHEILTEVTSNSRLKETLAQGISKLQDKPVELEKEEERRQMPFHMWINLQQLDCIYMITSMLMEIPNVAENQYMVNKKFMSRNFMKMIAQYEGKQVNLVPETYRDNIVMAAKWLNKSNWKAAVEDIFGIKWVQKIEESEGSSNFRELLSTKFKESALKTFLFKAPKHYSSISFSTLQDLFQLSEKQVLPIVSRLIHQSRIQAHLNAQSKMVVIDSVQSESKELHHLSLQYVDKMEVMIENNERLLDIMTGNQLYGYKERTLNEINMIATGKKLKSQIKPGPVQKDGK